MSSLSPEQPQTVAALGILRKALTKVDPFEHNAVSHLSMSCDEEADKSILSQAYDFDELQAISSFEELANMFDDDYRMAEAFLADRWNIDQRYVPWPVDESQSAATYFTKYKTEEFKVTITKWLQPNPETGEIDEMMGACIDPTWSLSPIIRVIYLNKEPLVSCKYSTLDGPESGRADWSDTGELTLDDIAIAEKVIRRIPFRSFD